jgi:hypothetical protein
VQRVHVVLNKQVKGTNPYLKLRIVKDSITSSVVRFPVIKVFLSLSLSLCLQDVTTRISRPGVQERLFELSESDAEIQVGVILLHIICPILWKV